MPFVSTHQPRLFPPMYIMERMARVHTWIELEEAQFDKQNAKIGLPKGTWRLPCSKANRQPFCDVQIASSGFWPQLTTSMQFLYGKEPGWKHVKASFYELCMKNDETLNFAEAARNSTLWCMDVLGIKTEYLLSRSLVPERPRDPSQWLAELTHKAHGTDYMQGREAMDAYMDPGYFTTRFIRLWAQKAELPDYASCSILHYLFLFGPAWTARKLRVSEGKGNIGSMEGWPCKTEQVKD